MTKQKNEHVVPRNHGWAVRREGSDKVSKLFATQSEAMDYAGRIAKKDDVSMVVHKHNGEFKNFQHGYEIHIKAHKISPLNASIESIESIASSEGFKVITFPIVNNTEPVVQTMT